MNLQQIKQRFEIIGNSPDLNRAINIASQVAATDLSVLITGESGSGKENFAQIIHSYSSRKHSQYIAVNCGAIPEGTIDSELFGHEKGAFTGAHDSRKGYFEAANGGTIFLDEAGELPKSTQAKLLRVLEAGEYIKVGSSKVLKTNVRVIAATNLNMEEAVQTGKFREDLFYRLNTVPIIVPPLRLRGEDISLLFRKFAYDFSEKYTMPTIRLDEQAQKLLLEYRWPGNVRQLKNITEQISIIEKERDITASILSNYLPFNKKSTNLPAVYNEGVNKEEFSSEREILYKILFDMRNEINELKSVVRDVISGKPKRQSNSDFDYQTQNYSSSEKNSFINDSFVNLAENSNEKNKFSQENQDIIEDTQEIVEESLSLVKKEKELIIKALEKYKGKRKYAAQELEISERTLYRKIKEYGLD